LLLYLKGEISPFLKRRIKIGKPMPDKQDEQQHPTSEMHFNEEARTSEAFNVTDPRITQQIDALIKLADVPGGKGPDNRDLVRENWRTCPAAKAPTTATWYGRSSSPRSKPNIPGWPAATSKF
jgi:hypothetical protein